MTRVLVPVRYPLSERSRRTLREAVALAEERGADLTVLHVALYQDGRKVERRDLRRAVEREVGALDRVRYVVRRGFIVEEAILEEAAETETDVVVVGDRQAGRIRGFVQRVFDGPDVERYLRERLDCEVVTVG
jgi:nucleotide-binding universal stress UspA family protein